MKKILIGILFINTVLASTPNKTILSSQLNGKPIQVTENEKELIYKSEGIQGSIVKNKCSEENRKKFYRKIEDLSKKSISISDVKNMDVEVLGKKKKISPNSPLGKFVHNLTQHLLTLKNESALACKS